MSFVFFGEVMQRLTPSQPKQLLLAAESFNVDFAGAESNVASSLSRLGHHCHFISKFPYNLLGDKALRSLMHHGVDTKYCNQGGARIGTYYVELGDSIRASRVIYDRENSAFAQIGEDEFDWHTILENQSWLFLGGITLALSEQCVAQSIKAATIAREYGVKVAFDLNFRRSLWKDTSHARKCFTKLLACSDLAFGNAGVVADVFGYQEGSSFLESALASANFIKSEFNVDAAFTARQHSSATNNSLSAIYLCNDQQAISSSITVNILDRLGTGDAFAAGILHSIQAGYSPQDSVNFANAAFALAHTQLGDQNLLTIDDIWPIAQGQTAGYVKR